MSERERLQSGFGPYVASKHNIETWRGTVSKCLDKGLVPRITTYVFPKSGILTAAVFLPSDLNRKGFFTISDDERFIFYEGENGEEIRVTPFVISNEQAAKLHMAGFDVL